MLPPVTAQDAGQTTATPRRWSEVLFFERVRRAAGSREARLKAEADGRSASSPLVYGAALSSCRPFSLVLHRYRCRDYAISTYHIGGYQHSTCVVAAELWGSRRRPLAAKYWVLDSYASAQELLYPTSYSDPHEVTAIGSASTWDAAHYMAEMAAVCAAEIAGDYVPARLALGASR
jgi:hypothetical protein